MIEKIILAIALFFTGGNTVNKAFIDTQSDKVQDEEKGETNKTKNINNIVVRTNWDDEYIENGYESFDSVIESRDGGFIAVGETTILEDGSLGDALIVKYDKDGTIVWQEAILGEDTDVFFDLVEDTDGSIYVIGKSFSSDLDFVNTLNDPHAIIVKYSADGTYEWTATYNDGGRQINYNDIIISNNNLVIVGNKVNNGSRTGFIRVVNKSDGTEQKMIYLQNTDYNTNAKSIIKTDDGSYVVIGNSINKTTSKEFPFIVKINENGNRIWAYELSQSTTSNREGSFNSVVELSDGTLIVGGFVKKLDKTNPILMKFNNSGNLIWENIESNDYAEVCKSVLVNKNNEMIATFEKTPNENVSLSKNLEVNIKRYDLEGDFIDEHLLNDETNIRHMKTIMTSKDKLVFVGRKYVKVDTVPGEVAKCETRNIKANDECLQANAFITMVEFFDTCTVKPLPEINIDNRNVVINKGDSFNVMNGVTATDEGKDVTKQVIATPSTIDTSAKGTHEITYKVSNSCGETVERRTITVEDPCDVNQLPVITIDNKNVTINKGDTFNVMNGVTATDEGQDITRQVTATPGTIDTSVKGRHEITYRVSDECGETTEKRTIIVEDPCDVNQLPVITIDNKNVKINKGDNFNVMNGVTATDEGQDITRQVTATPGTIDTSVKGRHEITYRVSDECGETTEKRTIIVEDPCDVNQLPVITIDNKNVKINKGDNFNVMNGVTATDEGRDITRQVTATPDTIDTSTKGTHTITYKVSDSCGETTETRTVVVEDPCDVNQLPVITIDNKNVKINKGDNFNVMNGVTATDEGQDITRQVTATPGTIDTSVKGRHEITYRVSDECGETTEKRTIIVEDPCDVNQLPVITIDNKNVTINKGDTFNVMNGVTATDEGRDITRQVTATPDTIDTSVKGRHEITYRVSDECGETTEKRTIIVEDPCDINQLPVINVEKENVVLELNAKFNIMDGVTATDEGKDITDEITYTPSNIDTSKEGVYEVIYKVSDECGEVEKKINVIISQNPCAVNEAPVINASNITLELGAEFNPLEGVSAYDKEEGDVTDKITVERNTVDTSKEGVYEVEYKIVDDCNLSVNKIVLVTVKLDPCKINELPVLSVKDIEIIVGTELNPFDGVSALDKENGDMTPKIEIVENTVNKDKIGEYKITYKISDECGEVEKTIKVKVKDKAPVVDSVVDEDKPEDEADNEKQENINTVKPQTGDNINFYIVVVSISIIGLTLLNKKEKK